MPERRYTEAVSAPTAADFAAEVAAGLAKPQKELPSKYLYDEVGSALFEVICALPEYGLFRAGARLVRRHAADIVAALSSPVMVAELGSGSGRKTRSILEACREPVMYYPIDISSAALAKVRWELSELGAVSIVGLEHSYLEGLREASSRRQMGQCLLVLFLGSTIGNFERGAAECFLREIRGLLDPGDALLLGTDLVKPVRDLLLAYDDPAGVTAAFNLNLLARMNRELGAGLNLREWAHEARWNEREGRVEMHLRSSRAQTVGIPAAGLSCSFTEGETIWTESCHKFDLEQVSAMAARTGFACEAQWVDGEWPFAESLWIAQ